MKWLWEWLTSGDAWTQLWRAVDIIIVLLLFYILLRATRDRRKRWLWQGMITLLALTALAKGLELRLLSFVLENLLLGSVVMIAVAFTNDLRQWLENLGKWDLGWVSNPRSSTDTTANLMVEEIAEAVKKLSQERIGALMVIETGEPIDPRYFKSPGTRLNARLSAAILQTIFQPKTLLHDGAVLIRGDTVVSAGVILPISARTAPTELGTRHRAAMGIAELVADCICIVVSEETGSIAIAEGDKLNRPVSNNDLREFLEERFVVSRPVTMIKRRVPKLGQLLQEWWYNWRK
ncbi:MAG: diadenylate cyclase CdaA [Pseudanabaenaceae cyanobacterium]